MFKQTRKHFGDQDRACIAQNPFEFSHTYFCDLTNNNNPRYTLDQINANTDNMFGSLANAKEAYNKLIGKKIGETENTLKDDSQVCVFKPAVQVLDNWGWCNGSCVVGYNWDISSGKADPIGNPVEGCYTKKVYNNDPVRGKDQCDPSLGGSSISENPWKRYNGAIIVIP